MPVEKIEFAQRQGRLFHQKLSVELSPKHKLCKLRELINWAELECELGKIVKVARPASYAGFIDAAGDV